MRLISSARMVDVADARVKHKEYHCSDCDYDTDEKSEFLEHISKPGHMEYGHINCSICGQVYTVPKEKPIPAILFRRNPKTGATAAAHPECLKQVGLI
jgi:hypothetical protein